jgi:hypothetical protein
MDTKFNDDRTVTLTTTFERLMNIDGSGQKIWATPNTDGEIISVYVNATQSWHYDFVCAHPSEFEYAGINFSYEDMTEQERDRVLEVEYTLTIPVEQPEFGE